jgi:branched-chain amino acid transport system substrate-binding protein
MKTWPWVFALLLTLAACAPPEPLKLGFLAGLSGRGADLGTAGRNGALLAVDEFNAQGGIHGRPVELLVRDNEQSAEATAAAVERLAADGVVAVIGPLLSTVAQTAVPVADKLGLVMVSPSVTASEFANKDDLFFRVASTTQDNTRRSAEAQYARGLRRIAIAYDLTNRAYTTDWGNEFRQAFEQLGGQIVATVEFTSGQDTGYADVVRQLGQARPDGLLLIANAVDTVHLIRQARNQGLAQPVIGVTWAATEQLLELGGRTIEGFHVTQFFNRDDVSPRYVAFREAYRARFRQEPGFVSVVSYDATRATLEALTRRGKQPLKQALLTSGPYQGLQDEWNFDRFGDARRRAYVTEVRNGRFVVAD